MSTADIVRPYELHADCIENFKPTEVFSIEKQKSNLTMVADDYISTTRSALDDTVSYLPFFAEKYMISEDIKDYVIVPVSIFLSGIPNKKGHTFTYQELTSADPYLGVLKFKTWERKPTYTNHKNKDYTKAKGIILSASLKPVHGFEGDLYKVILLQAFDRNKEPDLTNKILTGECHSYSMGSTCKSFKCGVCGGNVPDDRCGHIPRGMLDGSGFTFQTHGSENKIGYVEAQDILGFECSALPDLNNPANPVSYNQLDEVLRWQG